MCSRLFARPRALGRTGISRRARGRADSAWGKDRPGRGWLSRDDRALAPSRSHGAPQRRSPKSSPSPGVNSIRRVSKFCRRSSAAEVGSPARRKERRRRCVPKSDGCRIASPHLNRSHDWDALLLHQLSVLLKGSAAAPRSPSGLALTSLSASGSSRRVRRRCPCHCLRIHRSTR